MLDVREFRRAGHEAARRTDGTIVEFRLATGPTPSFHQAVIAYRERTLAVVGTRSAPLLAIAEPRVIDTSGPVDAGPLAFLDHPALAAILTDWPGLRLLTNAELDAPGTTWPDIPAADLARWRPATVGEALFHYWD